MNQPRATATFIGTFEQVFEGMFGPQQDDAHVAARRHVLHAEKFAKAADAADANVRAWMAEQKAERAAKRELAQHVLFTSQFNPSDDTWAAIKVYRDGNPIILDDGFKTQYEADDCADLARAAAVAELLHMKLAAE